MTEFEFTLETIEEWLSDKMEDEVVGHARDSKNSPIAVFIKEQLGYRDPWVREDEWRDQMPYPGDKMKWYPLSPGIKALVKKLDETYPRTEGEPFQEVTAQQVWNILVQVKQDLEPKNIEH